MRLKTKSATKTKSINTAKIANKPKAPNIPIPRETKVFFPEKAGKPSGNLADYGNTRIRHLVRHYQKEYAGNVWNAEGEAALIRALIHDIIGDLANQPMEYKIKQLEKIAQASQSIISIGEKHAKIEDALKMRVEFSQMQAFAQLILESINRNVKDPMERAKIASDVQGFMDAKESPL